jgi:hypothetical protein
MGKASLHNGVNASRSVAARYWIYIIHAISHFFFCETFHCSAPCNISFQYQFRFHISSSWKAKALNPYSDSYQQTSINMSSFRQLLVLGTAVLSTVITAVPVNTPMPSGLIKWAQYGITAIECDIGGAEIPLDQTDPQLPPPSHKLRHVVIGRGTQNYTCAVANDGSMTPEAAGAVATLYDASCLASNSPDLFHQLTDQVELIEKNVLSELGDLIKDIAGFNLIEGYHYFDQSGTPFFDLRQDGSKDWISTDGTTKAPSPDGSVDWLRLGRKGSIGIQACLLFGRYTSHPSFFTFTPTSSQVAKQLTKILLSQEVYRVETHGGQPPATCAESPASFEVEYSAEYWFFG